MRKNISLFVVQASACFILLLAQASACLAATLSEDWDVNINRHGHYSWTWKKGESVDMNVRVLDGFKALDLTGATVKFYWYTNTTANVWWEQPVTITDRTAGKITRTWLPSMDVGADQYAYWFGIWPAGSSSPVWRITGTINLLESPGFEPNHLDPPIAVLDFSAVTVTNQPWATPAQILAVSNSLQQAVGTAAASASNLTHSVSNTLANLIHGTSNTLAGAIGDVRDFAQTNRTTRLWSQTSTTNYMDAAGIFYEIVTTDYVDFVFPEGGTIGPFMCPDPTTWTYAAPTSTSEKEYTLNGDWHVWLWPEGGPHSAKMVQNLNVIYVAHETAALGEDVYLYPYDSINHRWFDGVEEGDPDSTIAVNWRTVVTTNAVNRTVNTNGTVIIIGSATDSAGTVTNLQAKAGGSPVSMDFFGKAEAQAAIDAIPLPPTNAVSGWLLYDSGSNMWLRVVVSNLSFKVYEVQ